MSDSGLGFSHNRFIGLMVLIAVLTLLFEWVSNFGGGLIKAQVEQTTSKYDPVSYTHLTLPPTPYV